MKNILLSFVLNVTAINAIYAMWWPTFPEEKSARKKQVLEECKIPPHMSLAFCICSTNRPHKSIVHTIPAQKTGLFGNACIDF